MAGLDHLPAMPEVAGALKSRAMTAVMEAVTAVITTMPVAPEGEMGERNGEAQEEIRTSVPVSMPEPVPEPEPLPEPEPEPVPAAVAKAPAEPTVSPLSETASGPKAVTFSGLDDVITGGGPGVGLHRHAGMNGGPLSRLDHAEHQGQGGNRHSWSRHGALPL